MCLFRACPLCFVELLSFPSGLWMVAVISWGALDGCCYFLVGSGWLLLFPSGLWMVAVIS